MIDLVIIYNHKYESNIPKLDTYYKGKFDNIWHLMPFYRGKSENVIPVYDNSFQFQNFIAQAASRLLERDPDYYIFISDDLLLDPSICRENIQQQLCLGENSSFICEMEDLSTGLYSRGVIEARGASLHPPGLEINGELPPLSEAMEKIKRHKDIKSLTLSKYTPLLRRLNRPLSKGISKNWNILKGNMWHRREQFRCWRKPVTLEFPFLGGYSDLFVVPRSAFRDFAHYCGVMGAARIFVELAVPTALALACDHIVMEKDLPRVGLNVWFPVRTWEDMESKTLLLEEIKQKCHDSLVKLAENWPSQYLYMHPIKLSKWKA